MIDGLSFLAYVLMLGIWLGIWGVLGALIANSRGRSFVDGLVQGVLLGPVGVVLMPFMNEGSKYVEPSSVNVGGDPSIDPIASGFVIGDPEDLFR